VCVCFGLLSLCVVGIESVCVCVKKERDCVWRVCERYVVGLLHVCVRGRVRERKKEFVCSTCVCVRESVRCVCLICVCVRPR
jgi:hypothetical protein